MRTVCDKLIRRHPHVFGDVIAKDSEEVLRNWEKIKTQERLEKHENPSILSGIPDGLPPLLKANRIQGKVAHVGFDWEGDSAEPLFKKLDEEIQELKSAVNDEKINEEKINDEKDKQKIHDHISEELGDVLFMTVNLARKLKIDPDAALSSVCEKFKKRFSLMEKFARDENKSISDYSLEELDTFWNKAKEFLKNNPA